MIKIIIADDHAIVRQGLKQIISEQKDMQVISEAKNAFDALNIVQKKTADVLILDISMPGRTGLEIIKEAITAKPALNILILSMHPEEQFAARVIKSGAKGFISKECVPEELVKAIRRICAGGKYVSAKMTEKIIFDFETNQNVPTHEILSDREFTVMQLIASGKTVTEIGAEMALSVKTISTYRGRILEKMKMKTNAELMQYAMKNKLVE